MTPTIETLKQEAATQENSLRRLKGKELDILKEIFENEGLFELITIAFQLGYARGVRDRSKSKN